MSESSVRKQLVEPSSDEKKKEGCACSCAPIYMSLLLCASIAGMIIAFYKYSMKNSVFPDGVTAKKIVKLMMEPIEESKKLWCKGVFWRIFMFYTYFILISIIGLLNCIPSVNRALDRKPRLPFCKTWRNVILGSFLWILMICWFVCIALVDLHHVKFAKFPIIWCYMMTSYWLNLTWTLAICLCTRNTLFQFIYKQNYASIITSHRFFGTFSFWMTIAHICFILLNWHKSHTEGFWQFLWKKITHYAWQDYHWKDVHFADLGFMIATDWILKILPFIFLVFICAIPVIRRKAWEWFYYSHVFILIVLIYLIIFHSGNFIYYAALPIFLYVMDKLIRWYTIYAHPAKATIQAFDDAIFLDVEVGSIFCNNSQYPNLVGSVAYINIPEVKYFEYHPMSIALNKGNHLHFYIKVTGNKRSWTHKLAALSGRKEVKAYIEGPYTMAKRRSDEEVAKKEKVLNDEYGKNIVIVGGGCGFAGVSSNLKDALELIKGLPMEEQKKYSVNVVLVVPFHSHLDCMKELILEAKKYDFCHVHLYSTYSQHMELKISSPKGKDANTLSVTSDTEEQLTLEFTVDRPNLEEILNGLNDEPISAFTCGPKSLCDALFKALSKQKRPFSYHPDIFDM